MRVTGGFGCIFGVILILAGCGGDGSNSESEQQSFSWDYADRVIDANDVLDRIQKDPLKLTSSELKRNYSDYARYLYAGEMDPAELNMDSIHLAAASLLNDEYESILWRSLYRHIVSPVLHRAVDSEGIALTYLYSFAQLGEQSGGYWVEGQQQCESGGGTQHIYGEFDKAGQGNLALTFSDCGEIRAGKIILSSQHDPVSIHYVFLDQVVFSFGDAENNVREVVISGYAAFPPLWDSTRSKQLYNESITFSDTTTGTKIHRVSQSSYDTFDYGVAEGMFFLNNIGGFRFATEGQLLGGLSMAYDGMLAIYGENKASAAVVFDSSPASSLGVSLYVDLDGDGYRDLAAFIPDCFLYVYASVECALPTEADMLDSQQLVTPVFLSEIWWVNGTNKHAGVNWVGGNEMYLIPHNEIEITSSVEVADEFYYGNPLRVLADIDVSYVWTLNDVLVEDFSGRVFPANRLQVGDVVTVYLSVKDGAIETKSNTLKGEIVEGQL